MYKSLDEIFHCVSIILYSFETQQLMFGLNSDSGEYFIPYIILKTDTFHKTVFKYIAEITGVYIQAPLNVLKIFKIWFPYISKDFYLNHLVVSVMINQETFNKLDKTKSKIKGFTITWIKGCNLKEKINNRKFINGYEVLDLINNIIAVERDDLKCNIITLPEGSWNSFIQDNEIGFVEIHSSHILFNGGKLSELLTSAKFKDDEIISIYYQHLLFSYPSIFMGPYAFSILMSKLGFDKDIHVMLFKAVDISRRNAISFRELLFFLAVCEPSTKHESLAADYRNMYFFCTLDTDFDGKLEQKDIKRLQEKFLKLFSNFTSENDSNSFTCLLGKPPIKFPQFIKACNKYSGIINVLRSPKSILSFTTKLSTKSKDKPVQVQVRTRQGDGDLSSNNKQQNTKVSKCHHKTNSFELALHRIKITCTGKILHVDEVENTKCPLDVSKEHRSNSVNIFNSKKLPWDILSGLRYFALNNEDKPTFNWGQIDLIGFGKRILTLCKKVRNLFIKEPRLLNLTNPVYVLGDIHGNFHDLIHFEKLMWKEPLISPTCLLFLGDFVDRGIYGLEVITYLFACKLENPNKFRLIRGNHEIRSIQVKFTFFHECTSKLGYDLGSQVWEAINSVFDCFPVAAVINDKIFCCHGGIPPPWLCPIISAINYIPVPLKEPEAVSPLAWELLWNDPISPEKIINDKQQEELNVNEGFAFNTARGTGHMFSQGAFDRFLLTNNLSHVIRAHELQLTGSSILFKGKLITVFSSSNYCGKENEAACIFIDNNRLRIINIETHDYELANQY